MRQSEAKELAKESDLVIVVGSKKSANTTHLAEILKDITKTIHIENDDELDLYKDLIEKSKNISITAGASTPQNVIERVEKRIRCEEAQSVTKGITISRHAEGNSNLNPKNSH